MSSSPSERSIEKVERKPIQEDVNGREQVEGEPVGGYLSNAKFRFYLDALDMLVPAFMWPFLDDMAAKSDDKTLVVSNITREVEEETDFLELFKPFGEVSNVKLGPLNRDGTALGGIGFVTFVSKKDAEQAMDTLNGYGPISWEKCTLVFNWASILKKSSFGGTDPSKLRKMSSSPSEWSIEKVEGKPLQDDVDGRIPAITRIELPKMFELVEGEPVGGYLNNAKFHFYLDTLDMLVPAFMWPFLDDMAAKSDDKTLVVSNITHEIEEETDFLELFKPFGEVSNVKLAPLNREGSVLGGIGFVTFVSKKNAEQAMDTLNGYGPRGYDKRTLLLNWASILKKST